MPMLERKKGFKFLSFLLKKSEKEDPLNPKKGNIKSHSRNQRNRGGKNKTSNRETNNQNKSRFFENVNKIDALLTALGNKKEQKLFKSRMKRGQHY